MTEKFYFLQRIAYLCILKERLLWRDIMSSVMKFAIIAAGEGSRLAAEGVNSPKPLVEICGEALVDRLLRIFCRCGASEFVVICNPDRPEVERHLRDIMRNGLNGVLTPLKLNVARTDSSMHSFFEISQHLTGEPFVLTTVDTIFREEEFVAYVEAFRNAIAHGADAMMGVTSYVDDEKPLYVDVDNDGFITGFYDDSCDCPHVSAGIYGLTPSCIETLVKCVANGESRMRNFQRALVREHKVLCAYSFGKVIDIDHASDIADAEAFLKDDR